MPEYRRIKQEGGIYFFTLVTYQRQELFASPEVRVLLMDTVDEVKKFHPFEMIAYCVMEDHVHLLWQMPMDDANYSMRIGLIKRRFSRKFVARYGQILPRTESQLKRQEMAIWQRRYWEHMIRDEQDLEQHIAYIHFNPVKHGLVNRVRDWDCSSFHDYVRVGFFDIDWGEVYQVEDRRNRFGE
jgi:putative transposase